MRQVDRSVKLQPQKTPFLFRESFVCRNPYRPFALPFPDQTFSVATGFSPKEPKQSLVDLLDDAPHARHRDAMVVHATPTKFDTTLDPVVVKNSIFLFSCIANLPASTTVLTAISVFYLSLSMWLI